MVGQAKRGNGSKKPAAKPAATTNNAEDSYIVFSSDANDGAKAKKADTSKHEVKGNEPVGENAPNKRLDTRKLIGGNSWTGKLPVNMLSEHCQKQRWEKPEYTMVCMCSFMGPWLLNSADGLI